MTKQVSSLIFIAISILGYAQVGINTSIPSASLDITAKNTDTASKDGILIPRISGADLKNKSYTVAQNSVLIYVTNPLSGTDLSGQVVNVNKSGFYYFDGAALNWKPLDTNTDTGNIYSTNGTLAENRVVNMNGKSLTFRDSSRPTTGNVMVFSETSTSDNNPGLVLNASRRVGFQTRAPRTSFDIFTALPTTADAPEGILIPKMTVSELAGKNMTTYQGRYTSPASGSPINANTGQGSHEGTLVYIFPGTDGTVVPPAIGSTAPSASKVTEVTREGLYYYGIDDKWHPVGQGIGDGSKDAWIDNSTNTRVELSTTSAGTARTAGTNVSFQDDGKLNLGASGSADAGIHLVGDGDGYKDDIRLDSYSGSTINPGPNFRMYASRGTQSAPVNLESGNTLGQINFHGRINNSFPSSARIWADYKGNGTTTLSNLSFSVNGYGNPSLVINSDQNVGIGTNSPNASMDIRKKSTDPTTSKDGVIPPVMTKNELANKVAGTYGASQTGAIVYVNDVTTPTGSVPSDLQVTNVLAKGHYTFDGTKWNPLYDSGNIAIPIKYGTMVPSTSSINVSPISSTPTPLKSYIELPPGKWLVTTNILLYANETLRTATDQPWFWTRFSFNGESTAALAQTSTTRSTDFVGSSLISGVFASPPTPGTNGQRPTYVYSMVSGQVIIENKTTTNKFYGLLWWGSESNISSNPNGYQFINMSSAGNGENVITAMKIQ